MTNPIMLTDTYRKIAARLTMFRPQIDLTKYFAGANRDVRLYGSEKPYIRHQLEKYGVAAATNTLDGVTFLAKDWEGLIIALRVAKTRQIRPPRPPRPPTYTSAELKGMETGVEEALSDVCRKQGQGSSRRGYYHSSRAHGYCAEGVTASQPSNVAYISNR